MDIYYCPECGAEVSGPPTAIDDVTITCPRCENVFHARIDNKFDWSIDWHE